MDRREDASFDAVFARWGYMLLADPDAALLETRRVLRSGGVVALAAWAEPEANPWMKVRARGAGGAGALAPVGGCPTGARARSSLGVRRRPVARSAARRPAFEDVEVAPMDLVMGAASLDALVGSVMQTLDHARPRSLRGTGARGALRHCVISSMRGTPRTCATTDRSKRPLGRWWRRRVRVEDACPMRTIARKAFAFYWGQGHRRRRPGADLLPRALARPGGAGARGARGAAARPTREARAQRRRRPQPLPARRRVTPDILPPRARHARQLAGAAAPSRWPRCSGRRRAPIGVIERCESRILECERHDIVTGRLRNMALGAGIAIMILAASAGAPVIGDARGRSRHPPHAAGDAARRGQHDRLDHRLRHALPLGAARATELARVPAGRRAGRRSPSRRCPRSRAATSVAGAGFAAVRLVPAARGDHRRAVHHRPRHAGGGRRRRHVRAAPPG